MYFVVDPDRDVLPQHAALLWRRLWEMRDIVPIGVLRPAVVTSSSPLLPEETADAVLATSCTLVPGGSAWAEKEVDLLHYARSDGTLRMTLLDAALRNAVQKAERTHDIANWPNETVATDSRLNRRLSIFVRGWGDLVALRGGNPTSHSVLVALRKLAAHVCAVLSATSKAMAEDKGYCPAIDVSGTRVLQYGEEMNARWRSAVGASALRHRNLLTLSPWDVFPRGRPADPGCANLLPLLHFADSVSLQRDADITHWNVNEFRGFHERVAALLRRCSEQDLIAKQV
jgi:hypothetical protein